MKPLTRNILWTAASLGLIAVLIGLYMFNKKAPDLSKVKPDYVLSFSELTDEFSMDEGAATAKYVDKVLEVRGPVLSTGAGTDSTFSVTLGEAGQMIGVICTFRQTGGSKPPDIKEGTEITVRGVCSGMLMDILLNNCVPVE